MMSFIKPHHPFDPPAPWDRMYDAEQLQMPPGWTDRIDADDLAFQGGYFPHEELTPERVRRVAAYYYATISQIDHHVGRCIQRLKQQGLYDETLIIYHADHGEYLGYRHLLLKGNHMYEPLMRVPLLLKWPQQYRAGQRSSELVCGIDLAPTILSAAGIDAPQSWPGLDLAAPDTRDVVFAEVGRGRQYMARDKRFKLLLSQQERQSRLFDLDNDPLEQINLFGREDFAQPQHRLELALWQWLAFDTPTPVHLDLAAPTVSSTDSADATGWQDNYDYFARQMRRPQES
jgi:arylsulfatase A-like enzyme